MEIVAFRDELEWLATQVSERCLQVITLQLQGFDNAEIAEKVQRSTRTVIRDKEKAQEILQKRDDSLKTEFG